MKINELVKEAFSNATAKGWHDKPRAPLEAHMLIVSEIAEATEAVRDGKLPIWQLCLLDNDLYEIGVREPRWDHDQKPEGEAIELADALIRIADYFGERGWDLEQAIKLKMDFNKTRQHRHGGKKF